MVMKRSYEVIIGVLLLLCIGLFMAIFSNVSLNITLDTDISTLANIGVAFATIVLAIFTASMAHYTRSSVETSENQLELLNKQFNLSQIAHEAMKALDQIRFVFNPLREELHLEIENLTKNKIYINGSEPIFHSLKCPIPPQKEFYISKRQDFELFDRKKMINGLIEEIQQSYPEYQAEVDRRYYLYLSICSKIKRINDQILSTTSTKMLEDLIRDDIAVEKVPVDGVDFEVEKVNVVKWIETEFDGEPYEIPEEYPIWLSDFITETQKILISEFWGERFGDTVIADNTKSVRKAFLDRFSDPICDDIRSEVDAHLKDLLDVDLTLLSVIDKIKEDHRKNYNLSVERLNSN